MSWRTFTNWAKQSPLAMRVADFLGRSRGRTHFLDRLHHPEPAPRRPDLSGWQDRRFSAAWIGHATVLLRVGGMTVLTDPVLSNRIGIGLGLLTGGPMRLVAPALAARQLPPIDLILVSHAHYDHLDRPTLCRLPRRIPVITSHNNADLIRDLGYRHVTELRWGEQARLGPLSITAREVRHWGARTFIDLHRGYSAFLIEGGGKRVLFGGDTAYQDYFRDIGRTDLAIFGIGAYDPYIQAHATPEQVWTMAQHARAERILAMHHSTFRLSAEPMEEPFERLLDAAGRDADRLVTPGIGDQWTD